MEKRSGIVKKEIERVKKDCTDKKTKKVLVKLE